MSADSDVDLETNLCPDSQEMCALGVPPVPLEGSELVPVDGLKSPDVPATKANKKGRKKVTGYK